MAATGVTKATLTINHIPTISRETSAYFVNSTRRLELVAANVPRFAFNPVTLAAEGLTIEQARTNVLSKTNIMMDGKWVRVGATLTTHLIFPSTQPEGTCTTSKAMGAGTHIRSIEYSTHN